MAWLGNDRRAGARLENERSRQERVLEASEGIHLLIGGTALKNSVSGSEATAGFDEAVEELEGTIYGAALFGGGAIDIEAQLPRGGESPHDAKIEQRHEPGIRKFAC